MSDGKTPCERLHRRPFQGQVAEFAEVVHFRDLGKAADMPKLDDRWSLGLRLGKSLASDEHYVGTSAGVRRCRSIRRRQEKQRWDRMMLTEMIGDPLNPTPQPKDKAPQMRGVYITLERQIKHGGKVVRHVSDRRRCIRQNAAAQTAASASEPNVETPGQAAAGPVPSPSSGPAPAAGGPASEDVDMGAAERSAAQLTSSAVRTVETGDDGSAKRQRLIACMPNLHETDVDVNVDANKMVVLAAMPFESRTTDSAGH